MNVSEKLRHAAGWLAATNVPEPASVHAWPDTPARIAWHVPTDDQADALAARLGPVAGWVDSHYDGRTDALRRILSRTLDGLDLAIIVFDVAEIPVPFVPTEKAAS